MKVYIRATVSIENLKTQFKDFLDKHYYDDDALDLILSVDPTYKPGSGYAGKYGVWLLNQAKKGNYSRSDMNNIRDALKSFIKKSSKFKYQDLGRYKTVDEFIEDSHRVGNIPLTDQEKKKQLKKDAHNADDEDKKLLAVDDNWELWTPLTYAGSISLAREGGIKAEWCTAYEGDDSYYQDYTSQGPLYIFINKNNPREKYQTHFETESWFYNLGDRDLGKNALFKFLAKHHEFLKPLGITIKPSDEVILTGKLCSTYVIKVENTGDTFRYAEDILHDYTDDTYIKVPNKIKKLNSYAFEDCTKVTAIDLNNVTTIGSYAFEGCTNLKTLDASNIEYLNSSAFAGSSLEEITLSSTNSCRGFSDCDTLKKVIISNSASEVYLPFLRAMPKSLEDMYIYSNSIKETSLACKDDTSIKYTLHLTNSSSAKDFGEVILGYYPNLKIVYDL